MNLKIWVFCGGIAVAICIIMVVTRKRKWKKSFILAWPLLFTMGPIGLIFVLMEITSRWPITSDR
jgi:NADH:ubiquinone oxidoreductase subunit 6 (subunit J)